MVDDVKYAILELNGEDFGGPVEHRAISDEIYEDDSLGRRVKQLLYSHPHIIGSNKEVEIPDSQQLINIDGLEVRGQLIITGNLVV